MLIWMYNIIQLYSTASRYVYSFVSYLYLQPRIYIHLYTLYISTSSASLYDFLHMVVFFSKPVTSPTLKHYTAAIIGWGSCWGCWRRLGNWTTRRMFCLSRFKGWTCRQKEGLQVLFLIDFKQQKYEFYFIIYTIYLRKVYTFDFWWNVNLIVFCMLLPFHLYLRVFLGSTQVFWIAKNGDPDGFFKYVSAGFVFKNLQLQVKYLEIKYILHV